MCLGLFDLWGSLHVYTWRFCKVNSVLCAPYPGPQLWPQCRAEPRQTGMWPVFSELCGRPCWLQCSRHLSEIAVPSATDFLCMEELCPLCPYTTVHPGYLKKWAILLECVLRFFIYLQGCTVVGVVVEKVRVCTEPEVVTRSIDGGVYGACRRGPENERARRSGSSKKPSHVEPLISPQRPS